MSGQLNCLPSHHECTPCHSSRPVYIYITNKNIALSDARGTLHAFACSAPGALQVPHCASYHTPPPTHAPEGIQGRTARAMRSARSFASEPEHTAYTTCPTPGFSSALSYGARPARPRAGRGTAHLHCRSVRAQPQLPRARRGHAHGQPERARSMRCKTGASAAGAHSLAATPARAGRKVLHDMRACSGSGMLATSASACETRLPCR